MTLEEVRISQCINYIVENDENLQKIFNIETSYEELLKKVPEKYSELIEYLKYMQETNAEWYKNLVIVRPKSPLPFSCLKSAYKQTL